MMTRIRGTFGRDLPNSALFPSPTIEQLALRLRDHQGGTEPLIVGLQPSGSRRPLFLVHALFGEVMGYFGLARRFAPSRPVFGFRARGIDGIERPIDTIEELATTYISSMKTIQPTGPYLIGAFSFGGNIAFEMAQRLVRSGEEVALLAMIDAATADQDPVLVGLPADTHRGTPEDLARDATAAIKDFFSLNARTVSLPIEELSRLPASEQPAFALEFAKRVDAFPRDFALPQLLGPIAVRHAHVRAARSYQPQVYGGTVTLFRCADPKVTDPNSGWQRLSARPVMLHEAPGEHLTLLNEPHVAALASALREAVETADG
jgi:thioesterase domain-containing protein